MKVGIMGGTFDPIHLGHLRAAENARESLGLDCVWIVPAGQSPHKSSPAASAQDRYTMAALATAGHPGLEASDFELQRPGLSYTVDTLMAMKARRPADDLYFIVGSDTCAEISTWREPATLLSLCRIAVVERPGDEQGAFDQLMGHTILQCAGPGLPISATLVRQRAARGLSLRYLVPDAVAEYIQKRGLYR
ncbi:MAG: nicotinate-nucleotide adenylyltransferase [Vicinamibacteria bacterium]|jgi:nicotinate-nucleotide adenylyltransferase|nr:nicotinate-nucleotide adenylyltransferase [Vicinamibacteria bacterium]